MKFIDTLIKKRFIKMLPDVLASFLVSLDTDKSYMLVLPEEVDVEDVKRLLDTIRSASSEINIVVIRSNFVRLIELGGEK